MNYTDVNEAHMGMECRQPISSLDSGTGTLIGWLLSYDADENGYFVTEFGYEMTWNFSILDSQYQTLNAQPQYC